jgi:phosphatidylserine/phosphatidylglycerophosphate/cardiolipin synthase-like enzyme
MTPKGMSTQPQSSHLFFLIDADTSGENKIAVTGSFNWEIPAESENDENELIIFNARVNNLYFQEFMARYREIE